MTEDNSNSTVSFEGLAIDDDNDPLNRMGIDIKVLPDGCTDDECACDSHFSVTLLGLSSRDAALVLTIILDEVIGSIEDEEEEDKDEER